ncbi:hypothetical protein K458DRAFT_491424 [Lentithecium fluviatile CBS 122367]|uniref:Heterokaryon incompatibility domain-containing protein n=1 Tax=Lentithecium fluviatile CBS 122367 TaxID=1168545 RepID=A0A6G1IIW9_9PLEO|nr:hypothetical protein K458DRAFT_491424 [Lentithecium fluviatile CBS 122367]
MQDDMEEMSCEISMMPEIYSRAVVTIAASTAKSVLEGFIDRRKFVDHVFPEILMQDSVGKTSVLGLVKTQFFEHQALALDRRAWAFQEHLLSTRILQFRRHQIRFICPGQTLNADDCIDGWGSLHPGYPRAGFSLSSEADADAFEAVWHDTVTKYSERCLTNSTDRILAFSGIARMATKFTKGDVYYAGHWMSMISRDLLWSTPNARAGSSSDFLGPSWAWTGVNQRVEFGGVLKKTDLNSDGAKRGKHRLIWEILKVKMTLVDQRAPFGAVQEAILVLRAPIRCVWLKWWFHGGRFRLSPIQPIPGTGSQMHLGEEVESIGLLWDNPRIDTFGTSYYLVLAARENSWFGIRGLILRAIDEENNDGVGRYVRCGHASMD